MQSQAQSIVELVRSRLAVVAIGFAAHFARVLALAPILGGLTIALKHVGSGFWICLILSIVEQFTGTGWRKRIFAFKYWAAGFGIYFLSVALFLFFFHHVEGPFWLGVFIFSALNGVLYIATLGGLFGFKIIGFVEDALVEKYLGVGTLGKPPDRVFFEEAP